MNKTVYELETKKMITYDDVVEVSNQIGLFISSVKTENPGKKLIIDYTTSDNGLPEVNIYISPEINKIGLDLRP